MCSHDHQTWFVHYLPWLPLLIDQPDLFLLISLFSSYMELLHHSAEHADAIQAPLLHACIISLWPPVRWAQLWYLCTDGMYVTLGHDPELPRGMALALISVEFPSSHTKDLLWEWKREWRGQVICKAPSITLKHVLVNLRTAGRRLHRTCSYYNILNGKIEWLSILVGIIVDRWYFGFSEFEGDYLRVILGCVVYPYNGQASSLLTGIMELPK